MLHYIIWPFIVNMTGETTFLKKQKNISHLNNLYFNMAQSSIEWTEMTWNPVTGCSKISAGCKYCYAEVMSRRLLAMGVEKYKDGFAVRTHESALNIPYTWKGSKIVFVNSM